LREEPRRAGRGSHESTTFVGTLAGRADQPREPVRRHGIQFRDGFFFPSSPRGGSGRQEIEITLQWGYTVSMKVAVSIPDPIFEEAERLAERLNTSRSDVYARALDAFAAAHAPDRVTEALDAAIEAAGERGADDFTREAARRVLGRVEW